MLFFFFFFAYSTKTDSELVLCTWALLVNVGTEEEHQQSLLLDTMGQAADSGYNEVRVCGAVRTQNNVVQEGFRENMISV